MSEENSSHTGAWIAFAAAVTAALIGAVATIAVAIADDEDDPKEPPKATRSASTGTDQPTTDPGDVLGGSASATVKPDSDRVFTPVYSKKRVTIHVAPDLNTAVVDLDRPKTAVMLEEEWDDGTSARLGYDFTLYGSHTLYTAVPWKRSSAAGAPAEPAECLEAARAKTDTEDTWLAAEELVAGEVICFETSEGNVARATFLSYIDSASATFEITSWK